MNLTRCSEGHFYDADRYASCPHCEQSGGAKTVPLSPPLADIPTAAIPSNGPTVKLSTAGANDNNNAARTAPADMDDIGKTVGIFSTPKKGKEPVTGWLVCTEGEHYGEDFRIKMGRNFIGRSKTMDIVLANDRSISREKHSIIVYEPKGNIFIIQPGDSKELSYLNDEVILTPKQLKPYDTIKLGATTLVFVPFCTEKFVWKEKDKEEDKK